MKEGDTEIKVVAEPNSTVIITDSAGNELGRGDADENGNVTIKIKRPAEKDEVLKVTATDASGNRSEATEVRVLERDKCGRLLKELKGDINQFISPDNDGKNDKWEIPQLKEYVEECLSEEVRTGEIVNVVKIYNRWGALVYEKENYMLDTERFEGRTEHSLNFSGEKSLPAGTYFYILQVKGQSGIKGYIYIAK